MAAIREMDQSAFTNFRVVRSITTGATIIDLHALTPELTHLMVSNEPTASPEDRRPTKRAGEKSLANRIEMSLSNLEFGDRVLRFGNDSIPKESDRQLTERGIVLIHKNSTEGHQSAQKDVLMASCDNTLNSPETGSLIPFDIVIGELDIADLDEALSLTYAATKSSGEIFLDIYSKQPFTDPDVLDDQLRSRGLYLRATAARSNNNHHWLQVDALKNPGPEIATWIRGRPYRTNATWDTFYNVG